MEQSPYLEANSSSPS